MASCVMPTYFIYTPQKLRSSWAARSVEGDGGIEPELAPLTLLTAPDEVAEPAEEPAKHPTAAIPTEIEAEMIGILTGERFPNECVDAQYRRKEQALGAMFATLGVAESFTLVGRLNAEPIPATDDLATRFARLALERKTRLLAFLTGARRRELAQPSYRRSVAR